MHEVKPKRALKGEERDFVQRLCQQAGPDGHISEEDIQQLTAFVEAELGYVDFYNPDWPGFGEVDHFPWSGGDFAELVSDCEEGFEDYDDWSYLDQATEAVEGFIEAESRVCTHLLELRADEGVAAWLIATTASFGQGEQVHRIIGLTKTLEQAEVWLRARGYFFTDRTPTGEVETIEQVAHRLLAALDISD